MQTPETTMTEIINWLFNVDRHKYRHQNRCDHNIGTADIGANCKELIEEKNIKSVKHKYQIRQLPNCSIYS
tara:strand:- start:706 stop:918 length:213 start_codon:yes stop_codon:yes gene_type:complete